MAALAAPRPASNTLGVVALVLAIVAAVAGVAAAPIQLLMQVRGGTPFAAVVIGVAVPIGLLSIAALVIGVVAALRPGVSKASPGAAIGIAVFLLAGQLTGLIATIVAVAL
ncbi:hypothetical protein GCM10009840_06720 [Pseudolysinimonas kribbensis]|uniref:DUF4190 domain-containing protein n=1 Tax=Pseudolysinimonas kribbensis TaxID=433641 RepID=A0ABQ6K353_9MICO|nr:hypothetical protein GCM10025881_18600 [Pseudolysinimonas kribbensis]